MSELIQSSYDAVHDFVNHAMHKVVVDPVEQVLRHRFVIHVRASSVAVRGGSGGARVVHADSPFAGQNVS